MNHLMKGPAKDLSSLQIAASALFVPINQMVFLIGCISLHRDGCMRFPFLVFLKVCSSHPQCLLGWAKSNLLLFLVLSNGLKSVKHLLSEYFTLK